jgi:hypothetical protein
VDQVFNGFCFTEKREIACHCHVGTSSVFCRDALEAIETPTTAPLSMAAAAAAAAGAWPHGGRR